MNFYIIIYILVIVFLIILGISSLKNYKKYLHGKFFILNIFFLIVWLFIYLISFTINLEQESLILIFSRALYGLALLSMYSMIFYTFFYGYNIKSRLTKYSTIVFFVFIFLFFISLFSPYVIKSMEFDSTKNIFYENYGFLYNFYLILYILFIPIFSIISYLRIKKINLVNKIRLKYISIGFGLFMFLEIIFLSVLPFLGVRLFEKEQVLFFIPFLFSSYFSIYKYHSFNLKVGIGKFFIFLFSLIGTYSFNYLIKFFYLDNSFSVLNFWGIKTGYSDFDFLLNIIIFLFLYNFLSKGFLGNNSLIQFERNIESLKKYIPYISTLKELNQFLSSRFNKIFKIKNVNLKLFNNTELDSEIYNYFSKDISRDLFINDIVFIEENKYKFDIVKLKNELKTDTYLVFPLFDNNQILKGILEISKKPFGDQFYSEEINILVNLKEFLIGHLKYIEIYSEINDLNKNLDKKIDQKTIELNSYISAQKDFIRMASHEIKTPLGGAIFQSDILLDEYSKGEIDEQNMKNELSVLNSQLVKVGKLVNNIFDTEKFDIKNVKMFFEEIKIEDLLEDEVERFGKLNPNVSIILNTDEVVGYVDIDKIQFTQVIDNILSNSIKYSGVNDLKIIISVYNKNIDEVGIEIEDNGNGFKKIDLKSIFAKYKMGDVSTVGIGMGLYLCKKIISMHNGWIKAENGKNLGGANFIISIPKKQNKK